MQDSPQAGIRSIGNTRTIGDHGVSDAGGSQHDASLGARLASSIDAKILAPTACDYSRSSCDGDCGGNCDGACGLRGRNRKLSNMWFSSETLLWFSQSQSSPALVTTSDTGVFPVLGGDGVTTAFGGADGIETGLLPGFRLEAGTWLDDCKKFGLSGRVFGILGNSQEYNASSDGTTSIGIPYFNMNATALVEDAYLVAFTGPGPTPVSRGGVAVRADLDMISAEGSLRYLLGQSSDHRVELIGGYSYSNIKNSLTLGSVSENLFIGDLIPEGTVFTTNDMFETENVFNGGHLGLLSSVTRKGFSLTTLGKVSFGNMRQRGTIRGYTIEEFQGSSTSSAGGIFAQPSNMGSFEQDVFAFIPEMGLKMGYHVNDNLQATIGYSFLLWSSVAMAGDQIDRSVDLAQNIARPSATFANDSFWMQGIDLGLSYTY